MNTDTNDILSRNLSALEHTEPELAQRLRQAIPTPLAWVQCPNGQWSASVTTLDGKTLQLASRFDPIAEAQKLTTQIDLAKNGTVAILGVGLGYHIAQLSDRLKDAALLIVYEPDLGQLRAVLEKIDHSAWLSNVNIILVDDTVDRSQLLTRLEKYSALLTHGTHLLHHPPTRQLYPQKLQQFGEMIAELLSYYRMHVATALVNASRTVENLMANLSYYAAGANTNELLGAAAGYPAICVSAGPSLARNIDLLSNPQIRKNVVVITTQTTLKPLLDRGIYPDFVTALDYHEISRRFYENLPPTQNVTLVFEAKGHPSILENFPGPVRLAANTFLSRLLGPSAPNIVPIAQGSTVAHLSVYLAQHLGCDPIILIGQDLGFSDGLYYCPGTAIHQVWAPELSPWNTLEMMEWQRIVRHRNHLKSMPDIYGQPIYTDDQMTTYLGQFERDFGQSYQKIIDATQGGLPKEHTTRMTLAEALDQYATQPVPSIALPERTLDLSRLEEARKQVRQRREELHELRRLTKTTLPLLRQMLQHHHNQDRVNTLFDQVEKNRKRVEELKDVFNLVNDLNTIGAFRRHRADRALEHAETSSMEKQKRQLQRDIDNLDWLLQAIDEADRIFRLCLDRLTEQRTLAKKNKTCVSV